MKKVILITPYEYDGETSVFKSWWGDDIEIVKIALGETPESRMKALQVINEVVDDLSIVVYHDFKSEYLAGFLDATSVREDIKDVVSLKELEDHNYFKFRTAL